METLIEPIALGLPVTEVAVPPQSSNAIYEREMAKAFSRIRDTGIRRVAFGDIFLEDLRTYRERQLAASGMSCIFPFGRSRRGCWPGRSSTKDSAR